MLKTLVPALLGLMYSAQASTIGTITDNPAVNQIIVSFQGTEFESFMYRLDRSYTYRGVTGTWWDFTTDAASFGPNAMNLPTHVDIFLEVAPGSLQTQYAFTLFGTYNRSVTGGVPPSSIVTFNLGDPALVPEASSVELMMAGILILVSLPNCKRLVSRRL